MMIFECDEQVSSPSLESLGCFLGGVRWDSGVRGNRLLLER